MKGQPGHRAVPDGKPPMTGPRVKSAPVPIAGIRVKNPPVPIKGAQPKK